MWLAYELLPGMIITHIRPMPVMMCALCCYSSDLETSMARAPFLINGHKPCKRHLQGYDRPDNTLQNSVSSGEICTFAWRSVAHIAVTSHTNSSPVSLYGRNSLSVAFY
ncbi:hypothetical protein XELAEV_18037939mg [Xenopus laevis]|uniref:Uncharacterized protein n=1 Tax=Xenopus laevis TaxID=8355 RepID=A0A974HAW1_XENLA|nr:hypothetical protein XELAEV_18037939mg [Xenopus laevis]